MADIWRDLTDAFNDQMAIEEMNKKYLNTYLVLLTPSNKNLMIFYNGFHDGYHNFTDELGVTLKFKQDTDQKIVCKFPERRLFNYNGHAYEFIRKPNRQYRRGICKDNCHIYNPIHALYGVGNSGIFDAKVLSAALEPEYPRGGSQEAIEMLQKHAVASIAISPEFFISQPLLKNNTVDYPVWYCNKLIGYYDSKEKMFQIKHPHFKQEVLDNLNLFKPATLEFANA